MPHAVPDFRKLWQQGFAKLAAVYFVRLFGFVIWVGLLISRLFFSGIKPPLVGGYSLCALSARAGLHPLDYLDIVERVTLFSGNGQRHG